MKTQHPVSCAPRTLFPSLATLLTLATGALAAQTTGCSPRKFNDANARSVSPTDTSSGDGSQGTQADEPIAENARTIRVADEKAGLLLEQASMLLEANDATMEKVDLCSSLKGKLTFDGSPLSAQPTTETLAYFSLLSSLAYKDEALVKTWSDALGFKALTRVYDKTTDTPAYVFEADTFLIVAFSGTATLSNWATDLDLVFDKTLFKSSVHKGFLRAYRGGKNGAGVMQKGVRAALLEALKTHGYPQKKLFLTGHSLGGALTTLLASDLKVSEQFGKLPDAGTSCKDLTAGSSTIGGVITYGTTRIGNAAFAECYNRVLGSQTWRVVNNFDIFPLMATRQFYAHTGQRVYMSDQGIEFTPNLFEEPQKGLMNFMTHLAKGGLLRNALDHVSYTTRLANLIDPSVPMRLETPAIL